MSSPVSTRSVRSRTQTDVLLIAGRQTVPNAAYKNLFWLVETKHRTLTNTSTEETCESPQTYVALRMIKCFLAHAVS